MYKENGKLDVELLAEVGFIAHRIRNLDEKLALDQTKSACFKYPYPKPAPTPAPTPSSSPLATVATPSITVDCERTSAIRKNSTHSIQIAQDIGNKLSDLSTATGAESSTAQIVSDGQTSAAGCGGRRYSNKHIEDIILEFYEKHLIYHKNLETERRSARDDTHHIRSKIYRLTSADNHNMNDSSAVAASNTAITTTTIAAETASNQELVEEGDPSVGLECESRTCDANDGDDAGKLQH